MTRRPGRRRRPGAPRDARRRPGLARTTRSTLWVLFVASLFFTLPALFAQTPDGGSQASEVANQEPARQAASPPGAPSATGGTNEAVAEPSVRAERAEPSHRGWLSLIPPLLAIGLALLFKDVVVALLSAVFVGAWLVHGGPLVAFARTIDGYVLDALADADHAAILIFSAMLCGMVGVMAKSGGTQAIIDALATRANSTRGGQLTAWLMGVAIFFDDYANTLIVGPTMRPITDRLRISREKLAYIVDSTAAPVVSLIPISTWIGFEIGLVQEAFDGLEVARSAFPSILESIPYRFYQFFALAFGFTIAVSGRDFGAMLHAEKRARGGAVLGADHVVLADFDQKELQPPADRPRRASTAIAPVLTVVAVVLAGLWITGTAALRDAGSASFSVRDVVSNANSYQALMWASLAGLMVAAALSLVFRILSLKEVSEASIQGVRAPLIAFVVLILAWGLGSVCDDLGTAAYLVELSSGQIDPRLVPTLIFVIAAAIAFATGTSWGTMAVLTPMSIPLCHALATEGGYAAGTATYETLLFATIASVLAGSVWGDHCSPIADTTILASMAAGSDHLAHVRTQLPYALTAGAAAVLFGVLPASFGVPAWICLGTGIATMIATVRLRGVRLD